MRWIQLTKLNLTEEAVQIYGMFPNAKISTLQEESLQVEVDDLSKAFRDLVVDSKVDVLSLKTFEMKIDNISRDETWSNISGKEALSRKSVDYLAASIVKLGILHPQTLEESATFWKSIAFCIKFYISTKRPDTDCTETLNCGMSKKFGEVATHFVTSRFPATTMVHSFPAYMYCVRLLIDLLVSNMDENGLTKLYKILSRRSRELQTSVEQAESTIQFAQLAITCIERKAKPPSNMEELASAKYDFAMALEWKLKLRMTDVSDCLNEDAENKRIQLTEAIRNSLWSAFVVKFFSQRPTEYTNVLGYESTISDSTLSLYSKYISYVIQLEGALDEINSFNDEECDIYKAIPLLLWQLKYHTANKLEETHPYAQIVGVLLQQCEKATTIQSAKVVLRIIQISDRKVHASNGAKLYNKLEEAVSTISGCVQSSVDSSVPTDWLLGICLLELGIKEGKLVDIISAASGLRTLQTVIEVLPRRKPTELEDDDLRLCVPALCGAVFAFKGFDEIDSHRSLCALLAYILSFSEEPQKRSSLMEAVLLQARLQLLQGMTQTAGQLLGAMHKWSNDLCPMLALQYNIIYARYYLFIGKRDKALIYLHKSSGVYREWQNSIKKNRKSCFLWLAEAAQILSRISQDYGLLGRTVSHASYSARMCRRYLLGMIKDLPDNQMPISSLASLTDILPKKITQREALYEPVKTLLLAYRDLAMAYSLNGDPIDTEYYLQQSLDLAKTSEIIELQFVSHMHVAQHFCRMGKLDNAETHLNIAQSLNCREISPLNDVTRDIIQAAVFRKRHKKGDENLQYQIIEEKLSNMLLLQCGNALKLNNSHGRKSKSSRLYLIIQQCIALEETNEYRSIHLLDLVRTLLRLQASVEPRTDKADNLLKLAAQIPSYFNQDLVAQKKAEAELMTKTGHLMLLQDPVYGSLRDSVLSIPNINVQKAKGSISPRHSSGNSRIPPTKALTKSVKNGFKSLSQATQSTKAILPVAVQLSDSNDVRELVNIQNSAFATLAATEASCGVEGNNDQLYGEFSRALAFQRIQALSIRNQEPDSLDFPVTAMEASPMAATTENLISHEVSELIPPSWNVITIEANDNFKTLSITRRDPKQASFTLKLPLDRVIADEGNKSMNLIDGLQELNQIVQQNNLTTAESRSVKSKESRVSWWTRRMELNSRLKVFLANVEKCWLGGFRGIFHQYPIDISVLASFKASFDKIVSKHLPSRRSAKRDKPRAELDRKIYELFVSIDDYRDNFVDRSELLEDLLGFVIDIFQFHGETNAYDEIEIDSVQSLYVKTNSPDDC